MTRTIRAIEHWVISEYTIKVEQNILSKIELWVQSSFEYIEDDQNNEYNQAKYNQRWPEESVQSNFEYNGDSWVHYIEHYQNNEYNQALSTIKLSVHQRRQELWVQSSLEYKWRWPVPLVQLGFEYNRASGTSKMTRTMSIQPSIEYKQRWLKQWE